MIDPLDVPLKLRARAETLTVLSITASIEATATGYARASGSFITDGFEIGQEITPSGFSNAANNNPKVITNVEDLALTTSGYGAVGGNRVLSGSGTVVEAAGSRTLAVKMPISLDSEGARIVPSQGIPWWREEWSPSPGGRVNGIGGPGSGVTVEAFADYFITFFVPSGTGRRAAAKYQKGILDLFPPGQVIALADALSTCRVRSEVIPRPLQMFEAVKPHEGFLEVPVVVPVYMWSPNS